MQLPSFATPPVEPRTDPARWLPPIRFTEMTPDPLAIADAQWQEASLRTLIGRMTSGISPASVIAAYTDWLTHLAGAPGKQADLLRKAQRKAIRLALYAAQSMTGECPPCIEPLAQDRRFSGPDWRQWPFNVLSQAFLLNQQWWWNVTTGVRGVTRHHEDVVTFINRPLLDMVAPSNFLATNPDVLQETFRSGGENLLRAAARGIVVAALAGLARCALGTANRPRRWRSETRRSRAGSGTRHFRLRDVGISERAVHFPAIAGLCSARRSGASTLRRQVCQVDLHRGSGPSGCDCQTTD